MEMCCMSWMYELIAIVSAIVTPPLFKLGVHNLHYIDAIVMFVVIPFVHLTNNEDTKTIILEENWYQGLRHVFGIYKDPTLRQIRQDVNSYPVNRVQASPSRNNTHRSD